MTALDVNARLQTGTLPHDPEAGAAPYMVEDAPTRGPRRPRSITLVSASQIAEPLPPVPYLVERLGIAAGAPTIFAGYGYSGKTMAAQALLLAVAAKRDVWGVFHAKEGRALHLDYEQGFRITSERYQRLARGMGVDLPSLDGRLALGVLPSVYLDDEDGADAFARVFEGFAVVLIDSLRAVCPRTDENSSDIRRHLDQLGRAAEKTGAVPLVIHHARKPKADDPAGAKYKLRGSSALFDACASVFVFDGQKAQPTRVTHEKCRNRGDLLGDFGLRVDDVALGGDPRAGLHVVHLEPEQLVGRQAAGGGPYADTKRRILDFLASEGGTFRGAKGSLRERVRIGRTLCFDALAELESGGDVEIGRDATGAFVRLRPESFSDGPGRIGTIGRTKDRPVPSAPLGVRTGRDEGGSP